MEIAAGSRPRIEYLDLESSLNAAVVDWALYEHGLARITRRVDRAMRLAWAQARQVLARWQDYDVVYSMGEDIGLALAWLMRHRGIRTRHILISHNLLSPRKIPLIRALGVLPSFAAIVVMTRSALGPVSSTYSHVADRLVYLPNFVDEQFWLPQAIAPMTGDSIMTVGRAKRDYGTLVDAVADLRITIKLHASSQWHVRDRALPRKLPPNVAVAGFVPALDLRAEYAHSRFVVVPLRAGTHHFAGTETVLEAMAMQKAVILAADLCPTDYLVPGETGLYVPAGNAPALRQAIESLVATPERAVAMGMAGRKWLETNMGYDASIRKLISLAVAT